MIPLRIMLPEGENKFREYIQQTKVDPTTPRPDLNQDVYSREFSPRVEVDESATFASKLDLARYLDQRFRMIGLRREDILGKRRLWTWLAYLWFDQLTNNRRHILKREEYYICTEPSNYRRYYLHLVVSPYIIYSLHGIPISMPFLYNKVYESNDFTERVAPNQFIISHKNLVETIYRLYYDESKNRPKRGATGRNVRGGVRRFIRVIRQFELTYDIYSMTSQQIIDLLPPEFEPWKTESKSP